MSFRAWFLLSMLTSSAASVVELSNSGVRSGLCAIFTFQASCCCILKTRDDRTTRLPHDFHTTANRQVSEHLDNIRHYEAMAPKKSSQPSPAAAPPSSTKPTGVTSSAASQPTKSQNKPAPTPQQRQTSSVPRNTQDAQQIVQGVWNNYLDRTPQRTKLLDAFMGFLMLVGGLQFGYCVVAGNYVSALYSYFC